MCYEVGRAALNLQWTDRVARTEYTDSWEIVRHFTGKDPRTDRDAWKEYFDAVHLDYLWTTHDGPVTWDERGRTTDMGHAVYLEDGSDFRDLQPCPFASSAEVLAFDAVAEYGLTDYRELVDFYERTYRDEQAWTTGQVISGGYYKTLVSGAIAAFGWDRLLEAVGDDADRFGDTVLGSIFEQSLHHYRAWAETSIEFFMCHDDMVWTEGPFINPAFYRTYIFPRYRTLWKVLKDAGKRVIFCSDGTYDLFYDDLIEAGADGFCFEPTNNLDLLVEKYGQTHVIMGGADCRTLTFGTREEIARELQSIFTLARACPGFVFATGNHFPANIPLDNAVYYFELVEELGRR